MQLTRLFFVKDITANDLDASFKFYSFADRPWCPKRNS